MCVVKTYCIRGGFLCLNVVYLMSQNKSEDFGKVTQYLHNPVKNSFVGVCVLIHIEYNRLCDVCQNTPTAIACFPSEIFIYDV